MDNNSAVMRPSRATVGWIRERLCGRGAGEGEAAGAGVLPADPEWPVGRQRVAPNSDQSVLPRGPVVNRHVPDRHGAARCRLIARGGALADAVRETATDGQIKDD